MESYRGLRGQWACRYMGVTVEGERRREGVTHHTFQDRTDVWVT